MAHEVNTPIAGLSSYAQMLLSETSPGDPRYSILKKMERQTFRAAHLVNNLLEFARPRQRTPQKTDLRLVLANAAESVETAFAGRTLELEIDAEGPPALVIGDARELEQVFVNLLTNARDASPEGGIVTCRLEAARRDDPGRRRRPRGRASRSRADRIFQPFYTTKKSGGTGLGLAISRDIVRRHGGEIALGARDGGGAEARVDLPARAGGLPLVRVLVVDDEEVIRDVLGTLLTREGYEVTAAATAGEAVALFEAEPYDVVLLDLMLPDRPGLEVLRDIRQRDPDAVVVIVTAYSSIEGAIEAMRQGAFHYIPKPFQNEEVLLTLRKGAEARRLTEENRRLREELSAALRARPDRRQVREHAQGLRARPPGGPVALDDPRRGRERHGQGARRAGDPHALAALGRAVRHGQLRLDADRPARVEPLRPRQGRVHGRDRQQEGPLRGRRRRLDLLRRDRHDLDGDAGEAPARPPGEGVHAGRLGRHAEGRHARHRRDQRGPEEDGRSRASSATTSTTGCASSRISIPPLRERREDIPLLVEHFMRFYASENSKPIGGLDPEAYRALLDHDWPGNVRELENAIERAVVLCPPGGRIGLSLLPETVLSPDRGELPIRLPENGATYKQMVEEYEKRLIRTALRRTNGVQKRAAELLKIKPTTLHEIIKTLEIRE